MTNHLETQGLLDLGDAVIETKGSLHTGNLDMGAGYRQWTAGLSDED